MTMAERKRVLILTADVGFGHRAASIAIAQALEDAYGDRCTVEVVNPLDDRHVPAFIRNTQTDYDKLVVRAPKRYKFSYELGDKAASIVVLETVLSTVLFQAISDLLQQCRPDVVIATNTMFPSPLSTVINLGALNIPTVTVITDLIDVHHLWFNEGIDLVVVSNEEVAQQAIAGGYTADRVKVTGIPVRLDFIRETRPPAALRAELGWDPDMTTALVVGSKRVKNLEPMIHTLNHSDFPMQFVIVTGGDDQLYNKLKSTELRKVVHLYNYIDDLPRFMRASDLVMSKAGGLIVSEALACGLPLLFIDVTPAQEIGNSRYVIENGAGDLATEPLKMLETLAYWIANDRQVLQERTAASRRLGRPRSAFDIADLVYQLAVSGQTQAIRRNFRVHMSIVKLLRNLGMISNIDQEIKT
jgi:1,2-diacylglycerol 3-beta-galactosyltransferase